jgi:hypothetical protein
VAQISAYISTCLIAIGFVFASIACNQTDPAANELATTNVCTTDPNGDDCVGYCAQDPTDSICPDACKNHPTSLGCIAYCEVNLIDTACSDTCIKYPNGNPCRTYCAGNQNSTACTPLWS